MYRRTRKNLGIWVCVLAISYAAVIGAMYLGRIYLDIIKEGGTPRSTKVNTGSSRSVVAPVEQKSLMLNPIPVYYLQVGVYTDMAGAQESAKPLQELGYRPYITESAPFRLWLGIYQKRSDTETVKQQLKDKGFGSFTASTVINGSNLKYNKGTEAFIREISPVLEAYTAWIKENMALYQSDSVERLDWNQVNRQVTVIDSVYKNMEVSCKGFSSNNEAINRSFTALLETAREYHIRLQIFQSKKNVESFVNLQNDMLKFVDKYQLFWQQIDNVSKT